VSEQCIESIVLIDITHPLDEGGGRASIAAMTIAQIPAKVVHETGRLLAEHLRRSRFRVEPSIHQHLVAIDMGDLPEGLTQEHSVRGLPDFVHARQSPS
jgi:hypothetical protein